MDLRKNENVIKEVIIQAQGEVCRQSAPRCPRDAHFIYRWLWKSILDKLKRHGLTILWTSSITRTGVVSFGT